MVLSTFWYCMHMTLEVYLTIRLKWIHSFDHQFNPPSILNATATILIILMWHSCDDDIAFYMDAPGSVLKILSYLQSANQKCSHGRSWGWNIYFLSEIFGYTILFTQKNSEFCIRDSLSGLQRFKKPIAVFTK